MARSFILRLFGGAALLCAMLQPAKASMVPMLDLYEVLVDTRAVVVARATEVDAHAYDAQLDQSVTRVLLTPETWLYGDQVPSYEFLVPGGFYPDGTFEELLHSPAFVQGELYLVFIRAGNWNYTPVSNWYHTIYTVENHGGRDILVHQDGRAVFSVDSTQFHHGSYVSLGAYDRFFLDIEGAEATVEVDDDSLDPQNMAAEAALAPDASVILTQLQGIVTSLTASGPPLSSKPAIEFGPLVFDFDPEEDI